MSGKGKALTAPSQGGDLLAWVREQKDAALIATATAGFASEEAFHRGIMECLREVLAGLVPLVAERDELRTKVTDAAVIAVAFDHEFRAIAKALGLGPSATAGEIAETVGAVIAERDAFKRDAANLLEALENRPEPWETREADHAHGEAQARVRKLEAARLWVMEGLRSSEVRAGEPTDAEMEAAGAVDKRLLTAGEVNDLCRQAEGLRARVAEIEAAARWVPVGEGLPPFRQTVLAYQDGVVFPAYVSERSGWLDDGSDDPVGVNPTHWRPLPAGPGLSGDVQPAPKDGPSTAAGVVVGPGTTIGGCLSPPQRGRVCRQWCRHTRQVLCRSSVDVDVYTGGEEIRRFPWSQWQTEAVPNLRAPATLGCMASLVQAHLAEMADRDAAHYHGLRVAIAWRDWLMGWRDDRALAMVAALEVDPAKVAP